MSKKDKIIDLLQEYCFNVTDIAGCTFNAIEEEDFEEIAKKIIELFNNPDDGNE